MIKKIFLYNKNKNHFDDIQIYFPSKNNEMTLCHFALAIVDANMHFYLTSWAAYTRSRP
jgi:hypothetical protein